MTRLAIDHDADGAYAVITRPGAPAERIPITHRDAVRLMSEAAQVVLVEEGRRQSNMQIVHRASADAAPPHFVGALGE
ncbi:hypothetical protein V5F32_04770 [Xanthobacter oligotrophicus]|uniref:DUF2188 domain-containing protein n=1 Tax=Xanthobacter oligotrophicus TaxID=2607286 RepID=A0ABW6ZRY0_9HYPH